ncbi:hypothetical protein F7725_018657 [Dissostichus mawsoni]|uniref:C2H2-type domain-containing protein n=1 Tax=Dissostichus mawsoni TaxID=36200 RepID=A0A7J5XS66_DISMA|nr:hypothetical protein F7725_018657 [Dissostichus mawsoni]
MLSLHPCMHCSASFSRPSQLLQHQRSEHAHQQSEQISVRGNKPRHQQRGLLYACEDCGLRFKDAPSRNRHQTLMHYSSEGREEEGRG